MWSSVGFGKCRTTLTGNELTSVCLQGSAWHPCEVCNVELVATLDVVAGDSVDQVVVPVPRDAARLDAELAGGVGRTQNSLVSNHS
jgi:hypothetical protein